VAYTLHHFVVGQKKKGRKRESTDGDLFAFYRARGGREKKEGEKPFFHFFLLGKEGGGKKGGE